jgi:acyl-CoA synthetase (AMP-forming)/AMP-acid ligase II
MTTMIGPLSRAMQVAAERPAVACGELRLTYAETWDRCRRLAGALRGLGLVRGDRVAVVGPNCHR